MVINHNIPALFANRQNAINSANVVNNMEKLASGLRINKAADDASGLAVSEKMRSQIKGLKQAARNTADFISFIQTTEGYIENTQNILQRVRELAVQSSNGIYTAEDRMQMQIEVSQLIDEIDRIASHAQFNSLNMLTGRYADPSQTDGTVTGSMWVHIGANMDQKERVFIATMNSAGLGLRNPGDNKMMSLSTPAEANSSIGYVDQALKKVSKQRADLGAYQNRLEFAQKALMIGFENLQAAESRIRDTDMAEQSVEFTKNQILQQASTSMLAQANSRPQQVLQLIR